MNIIGTDEGIDDTSTESVNTNIAHVNVIKTDEEGNQTTTKTVLPTVLRQEGEEEQAVSGHTHIQWLLAKIGHKLGCHIWIAANDQGKVWNGERLGDLRRRRYCTRQSILCAGPIIHLPSRDWLPG